MNDACPRCGRRFPTGRVGVCPVCVIAAPLEPAKLGESLELIEEIGEGGMGSVWKARHLRLDRTVAVKFLRPDLAAQPDWERRFEREARALALLNHPGIVAVHDFGVVDGKSFIVMEYVVGRPLSEAIPIEAPRAVTLARQLCQALAYAHERGVVHRDIKPQNVLLDAAGNAKLSDFGIARLMHATPEASSSALTATGGVLGTPRYMAPEALAGAAPDPRMDVFSLGVVLNEMVTTLPVGLDAIVRKALARDPAERYASARELERALGEVALDSEGLPDDERDWLRATALLLTLATAVALWAFVQSVTPKLLAPHEVQPLIMRRAEPLRDGHVVSRARFETWPTLAAIAALATALGGYAALRRHWRAAGLLQARPHQPLRESRLVFGCGAFAVSIWLLRMSFASPAVSEYVPILGGLIEVAALLLFWTAVLQGLRRSRPLAREAWLWLGMLMALVPPAWDLASYLSSWHP